MAAKELVPEIKKPAGSEALSQPTPLDLLQQAMAQGLSIEQLERFQEMYYRSEADKARKAFFLAMSEFKAESIVILRDKTNNQYQSKYVSLGNLVNTVTPFLSRHDLSATWEVDQTSGIKVTCILKHALGHTERVAMTVPPDTSGAKNPIQQIKSAITYAKVCTFESACGLASSDANLDDDGNGTEGNAEGGAGLSDERFVRLRDGIANCNSRDELKTVYLAACKEADGDQNAKREFNTVKNARYKELFNAGR